MNCCLPLSFRVDFVSRLSYFAARPSLEPRTLQVFILFFLPDRPTHHHKRQGDWKRNILLGWPNLYFRQTVILSVSVSVSLCLCLFLSLSLSVSISVSFFLLLSIYSFFFPFLLRFKFVLSEQNVHSFLPTYLGRTFFSLLDVYEWNLFQVGGVHVQPPPPPPPYAPGQSNASHNRTQSCPYCT